MLLNHPINARNAWIYGFKKRIKMYLFEKWRLIFYGLTLKLTETIQGVYHIKACG